MESIPQIRVTKYMAPQPPSSAPHVAETPKKQFIPRNKRSFLYRSSVRIVSAIESGCGLWGQMVSHAPWTCVIVCLALVAAAGCGLYNLNTELRPYKLWIKEPSEFTEVNEWKMKMFPSTIRKHTVIWEAENILTAKSVRQIWHLHQSVNNFTTPKGGVTYKQVCLKVPSLISQVDDTYDYDVNLDSDYLASLDLYYDEIENNNTSVPDYRLPPAPPSSLPAWMIDGGTVSLDKYAQPNATNKRDEHCEFVEHLQMVCYEESLLEVWGYNDDVIQSLTDEKVIRDINTIRSSEVTGFPFNISAYLGGIERDYTGKIMSAKGALHVWYTQVNLDSINHCKKGHCIVQIDLGSGEEVDHESLEWEITLSEVVKDLKQHHQLDINLQASYSFGLVHRSSLLKDVLWVCIGWCMLMLYVVFTLGKPFTPESKIIPVLVGIVCVGLAVLASYGLCTFFGIPYGPLNSVLPVLLIALGVDDMYVIVNAWEAAAATFGINDIKSRTKKSLHQAGLAITVTSLTDIIAFIMGATTDVPALRWFCVYAAVGITMVYILQCTIFVAALVINQKQNKITACSCIQPFCCTKFIDGKWNIMTKVMTKWSKFILKPPVTAFVLLGTGVVLGGGLCTVLNLKQRFESIWLLPKSSDLHRWFTTMDEIFPKDGREGFVFFENVSLPEELPELQRLVIELKHLPYISRVDAWVEKLVEFMNIKDEFVGKKINKELFQDALSYFLYEEEGAKYRNHIVFDSGTNLTCRNPAPNFNAFKINFQYIRMDNVDMRHESMNKIREIVSAANLTGFREPWVLSYGQWETEKLISWELLRNLFVVIVIVTVMTMILLASCRAAILVLICVLATLVDVAALMHLWGLTINTVTCIALVLAIGICVDYSAHITHGFLVAQGTRKIRVESSLTHMGSAVFHGGMSTLIAFLLLAPSDTFVFVSYFKILTGVAVFGLYHALVLLPILLALLGPPPYPESSMSSSSDDSESYQTESTTSYTPSCSITPTPTPQSTTPNSPTSNRTPPTLYIKPNLTNEGTSTTNDQPEKNLQKTENAKEIAAYTAKALSKGLKPPSSSKSYTVTKLGPQAIKNVQFHYSENIESAEKVKPAIDDEKEIDNKVTYVEKAPKIEKENIVRVYVSNS